MSDYNESAAIQARKSTDELARNIHERHSELQCSVASVRASAEEACKEAINIAQLVAIAHAELGGKRFIEWWREQKLPNGWAGKYLRIAATASRKTIGDKDQLRMIGILPESDSHNAGTERERKKSGIDWAKWIGKTRAELSKERVSRMSRTEAEVAITLMKPLIEVYNELRRMAEA